MNEFKHNIEQNPEEPFDINEIRQRILDETKEIIIKPQDKNPEGNLLVYPDGPESNLNEQNWKIVRTKSFKEWFGDWQKGENCSAIIDKNGEPKIVTHRANEDEIVLQPPRKEFSVSSRFMHFTSEQIGGKPSWRYGDNIHLAFLNIRKLFNGRQGLPYYDYPNSEKAGFIGDIDDDFLNWLHKKEYNGAYDPGIKRVDDPEKPAIYTDEYVALDPQKQVLFIDTINTKEKDACREKFLFRHLHLNELL